GRHQTQQHLERSGLAGSVGAEKTEHLPPSDRQGEVGDRERRAVALAEPVGLDDPIGHCTELAIWSRSASSRLPVSAYTISPWDHSTMVPPPRWPPSLEPTDVTISAGLPRTSTRRNEPASPGTGISIVLRQSMVCDSRRASAGASPRIRSPISPRSARFTPLGRLTSGLRDCN